MHGGAKLHFHFQYCSFTNNSEGNGERRCDYPKTLGQQKDFKSFSLASLFFPAVFEYTVNYSLGRRLFLSY